MKISSPDALIEQLHWRYAVKKFDATKKVSPADFAAIERAALLAPSSYGLQPWHFVVVTSADVKAKLVAASYGQHQVADCSHLIVFAVRKRVDAAYVDRFLARTAEVRHVPVATLDGYRSMILGTIGRLSPEQLEAWSARQVYIALGFVLSAAAAIGVDTCPMEGIVGPQYDDAFGLAGTEFKTLAVAAIGYRAADDSYAALPKVRFDPRELVTHVD